MTVTSPERLRGDLKSLLHRSGGVRDFSLGAGRVLARAVPFDGICVVTMDPATLLPTGEVVENALPPAATARMAEIEIGGEDFNTFRTLGSSGELAASLSEATSGDLDQSLRHRGTRRPNGFGDELRAALVCDSTTWGGLTLLRAADRDPFSPAEVSLVASLAALRRRGVAARDTAHLAVFGFQETRGNRRSCSARSRQLDRGADAAAEQWLAELRGPTRCTGPGGGHRRGEPSAQHREPAPCRDGCHCPRACPDGVGALVAGARLDARRGK